MDCPSCPMKKHDANETRFVQGFNSIHYFFYLMIASWITAWICAISIAMERNNGRLVLDVYAKITLHWIAVCHPRDQHKADKDRSMLNSSNSISRSINNTSTIRHNIVTIIAGTYSPVGCQLRTDVISIFVNEKFCNLIKMSLSFVPKRFNDNNSALIQVLVWRLFGAKPFSEATLTLFTDAYMRRYGEMIHGITRC